MKFIKAIIPVFVVFALVLGLFFIMVTLLLIRHDSYTPSSGIWQYKDDDLIITVYVPEDGGVKTPAGFLKCETVLSYKGETYNAVLGYHTKMYQFYIVLTDNYEETMSPGIGAIGGIEVIRSTYRTPMKKDEWEFVNIRTDPNYLNGYSGKDLILTRIGEYTEPETALPRQLNLCTAKPCQRKSRLKPGRIPSFVFSVK